LRSVLESSDWLDLWQQSQCAFQTLASLGLSEEISDRVLWHECQQRNLVLLTINRNAEGPDALEAVIRERNTADSLPVLTISRDSQVFRSRNYADRVAIRLLDYIMNIENHLGAGRLYIP
jgi:hypothetical protein